MMLMTTDNAVFYGVCVCARVRLTIDTLFDEDILCGWMEIIPL